MNDREKSRDLLQKGKKIIKLIYKHAIIEANGKKELVKKSKCLLRGSRSVLIAVIL